MSRFERALNFQESWCLSMDRVLSRQPTISSLLLSDGSHKTSLFPLTVKATKMKQIHWMILEIMKEIDWSMRSVFEWKSDNGGIPNKAKKSQLYPSRKNLVISEIRTWCHYRINPDSRLIKYNARKTYWLILIISL